jgi:flavin reductase (DIM6/NTAB) family NADH-FMN oxidoreductase RutF
MTTLRFSADDIQQMESRNRASFMNSLSGFKSASMIGTIDANSKTNLAIFSSVVHIGSNPALIGFINRPDSVNRHTLENILESKCFTVNHVNQDIFREAHQTSARYPKNISEFEATGLTAEFGNLLKAPYVKESHIKYGLEFVEKHDLKINGTIVIIGKVVEISIPENCLLSNGSIDIERAETIAISGLDSYHTTSLIARLNYAKTDSFNQEIIE